MTRLWLAPASKYFPWEFLLGSLDQHTLLGTQEPFLIVRNHLRALHGVVDVVENEGVAVDALLRRDVGGTVGDVAAYVDVEGGGFPVYHGH